MPGQPRHAREHRRRSRQDQGTRAGHHEHGHGPRPDVGPAEEVPRDQGDGRGDLDRRQEVAGQPVGQPLDVGLLPPGLRDHPDDLAERGVAADLLGADLDDAVLVQRTGEDGVGRPLVHRERLAGQGRLVDRRPAGFDRAVDRDSLPRPDDDQVSHGDVPGGDLDVDPIAADPRRAGRLVDKAPKRPLRPAERDRLQHLADQGDEDHLGGDERLPQHQGRDASLREREVGPDPPLDQGLERPVDDVNGPGQRRDHHRREPQRQPPADRPAHPIKQIGPDQQPEERREGVEPPRLVGLALGRDHGEGVGLERMHVLGAKLAVHRYVPWCRERRRRGTGNGLPRTLRLEGARARVKPAARPLSRRAGSDRPL